MNQTPKVESISPLLFGISLSCLVISGILGVCLQMACYISILNDDIDMSTIYHFLPMDAKDLGAVGLTLGTAGVVLIESTTRLQKATVLQERPRMSLLSLAIWPVISFVLARGSVIALESHKAAHDIRIVVVLCMVSLVLVGIQSIRIIHSYTDSAKQKKRSTLSPLRFKPNQPDNEQTRTKTPQPVKYTVFNPRPPPVGSEEFDSMIGSMDLGSTSKRLSPSPPKSAQFRKPYPAFKSNLPSIFDTAMCIDSPDKPRDQGRVGGMVGIVHTPTPFSNGLRQRVQNNGISFASLAAKPNVLALFGGRNRGQIPTRNGEFRENNIRGDDCDDVDWDFKEPSLFAPESETGLEAIFGTAVKVQEKAPRDMSQVINKLMFGSCVFSLSLLHVVSVAKSLDSHYHLYAMISLASICILLEVLDQTRQWQMRRKETPQQRVKPNLAMFGGARSREERKPVVVKSEIKSWPWLRRIIFMTLMVRMGLVYYKDLPTWTLYLNDAVAALFIWGLVNQGVQCQDCQFACHFACQENAPPCKKSPPSQPASPSPASPKLDTSKSVFTTPMSSPHINTVSSPSSASRSKTPSPLKTSQSLPPPSPSTPDVSIVAGLTNSTVKEAINMEAERKASQPPLNLLTTTPKNFAKFITRVGVIREVQDEVVSVLMWESNGKTMFVMALVVVLSLYPILLIITPQAAIIYLIVRKYYAKAKGQIKSTSGEASAVPVSSTGDYSKNMQFIQNSMGQFTDVHDAALEYMKIIDWSDENKTSLVLKMTVASALAALVVTRFIPTRFIFMVMGITPFLANAAFIRALITSMPTLLVAKITSYYNRGRDLLHKSSHPAGNLAVVEIYQNERWWAGLGYIPHLLHSERTAWSDETGSMGMPSTEEYVLPSEEWEWDDEEWGVDRTWNEVDENGWCYSDHSWTSPRKTAGLASFTRRRLWTRTMKKCKKGTAVAASSTHSSPAVKATPLTNGNALGLHMKDE
ncbi:hypothetical protein SmJEL517_g03903 [Synchytrium microbalum]|uniref:Phorbol-ester/DAG-type domain-containing protein n=1 Tax=Synchytrium microbalum TaxID=1806994 RepID=A0A507C136_9FUNG|nr:uncharacterized protein SmJEL517_g03903 [Synchytrium microbalum]TPX33078.1 hypothetical protein SmJEL517_g03903 [Synchytrium microbalum]